MRRAVQLETSRLDSAHRDRAQGAEPRTTFFRRAFFYAGYRHYLSPFFEALFSFVTGTCHITPNLREDMPQNLAQNRTGFLASGGRELAGGLNAKGVKPAHLSRLGIPVVNLNATEAAADLDALDAWLALSQPMEHGLRIAGTAAVLGRAKTRGLIPSRGIGSAREAFARLHGADFRISAQVIETVLKRVGE